MTADRATEMILVARPEFVERAEKHLEGITDGTLFILKAHLLLEEGLYEAICAQCENPGYIDKARLSFHQQVQVARALYGAPPDDPKRAKMMSIFWDAAEALNVLRNRCAHSLEPSDLEPLLQRLSVPDAKNVKSLSDPNALNALAITACILIGYAWGLANKSRKDQEPQPAGILSR